MNLDRSSPAPLLSSQASDEEGDITIIKDTPNEEEQREEEGQIPFLDQYGEVSLPSSRNCLNLAIFDIPAHKYNTYLFGLFIMYHCLPLGHV